MAKIHPIEKCNCCGALIYTLGLDNKADIDSMIEDIENFVGNKLKGEDFCLGVFTDLGVAHNEADITYFLCGKCCKGLLETLIRNGIKHSRKILFRNFDAIKKELQNA